MPSTVFLHEVLEALHLAARLADLDARLPGFCYHGVFPCRDILRLAEPSHEAVPIFTVHGLTCIAMSFLTPLVIAGIFALMLAAGLQCLDLWKLHKRGFLRPFPFPLLDGLAINQIDHIWCDAPGFTCRILRLVGFSFSRFLEKIGHVVG